MYGVCKICGCTDNNACQHPDHGSCFWIDDFHELCSHCWVEEIRDDPATEHPKKKGFRELPILFSTSMVEAIQDNRKKMTRRTQGLEKMNILPDAVFISGTMHTVNSKDISFIFKIHIDILNIGNILVKPRYQVGDHIWVRETYFDTKLFKSAPLFCDGPDFIYRADPDSFIGEHKWKPSLFMPKVAARIWLECTGVRCERLYDISEHDAKDEGVERVNNDYPPRYRNYTDDKGWLAYPTHSFYSLWRKINGKDSVRNNPWVFVYEFKKIDKP